MTDLEKVKFQDIELVAKSCSSLNSVKISDCEILNLLGFFRAAYALEEFGGGSFNDQPEKYSVVSFPPKLTSLGLTYMGKNEMPIVFPFGSNLKKLDLLYALLDMEDHCVLIQRCPNLEILEVEYKILLLVLSYYLNFVNTCIHIHGFSYSFFLFTSVIRMFHNMIYGKICITWFYYCDKHSDRKSKPIKHRDNQHNFPVISALRLNRNHMSIQSDPE